MINSKYADISEMLSQLKEEFPYAEITNINAKGEMDRDCAWIFDSRKPRRCNVLIEAWDHEKNGFTEYVINYDLCTPSEKTEAEKWRKASGKRGMLRIYNIDRAPLDFVREKLEIYFGKD